MSDIIIEKRKKYFAQKFRKLYDLKWKSNGKSQEDFARAIREHYQKQGVSKCSCTYRYVSEWYNGKKYPEMYLESIAAVLGVDESEFMPTEWRDQYLNAPEYQDRLRTPLEHFADQIGLSKDFIRTVREITDFEREFPVYSKLIMKSPFTPEYVRSENAESAPMTEESDVFQMTKAGKTITLSGADLKFLGDVQIKVAEYIKFLFFQREHEMQQEEIKANEAIVLTSSDHGTTFRERLSEDELQEIEHYRKYIYGITARESV